MLQIKAAAPSARLLLTLLTTLFLTPAGPVQGDDFAPIRAEERNLTSVPGYPNAPAIVLFRKGNFKMMDLARGEQSSVLTVETRLKILSEEGLEDYGEVEVFHSRWVRLSDFTGRTVLPDGKVIPLTEDSIFERESSRSLRLSVTAAAFPGLTVGAILDYRYQVRFDSIYFLEPWVFQEEVPALLSEITYHVPKEISARAWQRDPVQIGIQHESQRTGRGSTVRVWAENVPAVLDEPWSFPEEDLSARFMLVPVKYLTSPLLDTWATTTELVETDAYNRARRNNTVAKSKARKLVQEVSSRDDRQKAEILYRFVRDQIATSPRPGVLVDPTEGPDKVLRDGRGDSAEKAFLLHSLLDAVKVDADLIWAASRWGGAIDTSIPSFRWFDRMLIRVRTRDEVIFLDPAEPGMPFGRIAPEYEGTQALVYDRRNPEVIILPETSFDEHQRRATIALELDEEGRLAGEGELVWTGHHGASRIAAARRTEGGAEELWKKWLDNRYESFVVKDVKVEQSPSAGQVNVSFHLELPEEEVLGDEVSFLPSRPLGPSRQIFPLPPSTRRTPVMFNYGDRDVVELTLTWPEGWEIEARPEDQSHSSQVGAFSLTCELDPETRKLTLQRRLDIASSRFLQRQDYGQLRDLFATAEASDAQELALLRR